MQLIDIDYVNEKEQALVEIFLHDTKRKKYILGINRLTKSVQKFPVMHSFFGLQQEALLK